MKILSVFLSPIFLVGSLCGLFGGSRSYAQDSLANVASNAAPFVDAASNALPNWDTMAQNNLNLCKADFQAQANAGVPVTAAERECYNAADDAQTWCATNISPLISKAAALVGTLQAAADQTGIIGACTAYSTGMNVVRDGLIAYNAECGVFLARCSSSCDAFGGKSFGKLKKGLTNIPSVDPASSTSTAGTSNTSQAPSPSGGKPGAPPVSSTSLHPLAGCKKACGDYWMNLAAGGAGLLDAILAKSKTAAQCAQVTATASASPTPTNTDCTVAANANLAECICKSTPNSAGCQGGVGTGSLASIKTNQVVPGVGGIGAGVTPTAAVALPTNSSAIHPGAGVPSAALGGLDSGAAAPAGAGLTPSAGDGSGKGAAAVKSNAFQLFNGDEYGGGGGGGSGGRGSSRDNASLNANKDASKFNQRNPAAAGGDLGLQVRGPEGIGIFDSINGAYKSARPSLNP